MGFSSIILSRSSLGRSRLNQYFLIRGIRGEFRNSGIGRRIVRIIGRIIGRSIGGNSGRNIGGSIDSIGRRIIRSVGQSFGRRIGKGAVGGRICLRFRVVLWFRITIFYSLVASSSPFVFLRLTFFYLLWLFP